MIQLHLMFIMGDMRVVFMFMCAFSLPRVVSLPSLIPHTLLCVRAFVILALRLGVEPNRQKCQRTLAFFLRCNLALPPPHLTSTSTSTSLTHLTPLRPPLLCYLPTSTNPTLFTFFISLHLQLRTLFLYLRIRWFFEILFAYLFRSLLSFYFSPSAPVSTPHSSPFYIIRLTNGRHGRRSAPTPGPVGIPCPRPQQGRLHQRKRSPPRLC